MKRIRSLLDIELIDRSVRLILQLAIDDFMAKCRLTVRMLLQHFRDEIFNS